MFELFMHVYCCNALSAWFFFSLFSFRTLNVYFMIMIVNCLLEFLPHAFILSFLGTY